LLRRKIGHGTGNRWRGHDRERFFGGEGLEGHLSGRTDKLSVGYRMVLLHLSFLAGKDEDEGGLY
jgi:hypothetical protein